MKGNVRQPKQERSIETKNKLINAAYELFSEEGYYSTNTVLIAKRAGVSTGIVYGYFKDKRDILLEVLELYINRVFEPILKIFDDITFPIDFGSIVPFVVDTAITTHKNNAKIHEALHALTHTDEVVSSRFIALEDQITLNLAKKFEQLQVKLPHTVESIHLAMDVIQSFAHECVYDKHEYIDYDEMKSKVCQMIIYLFKIN